MLFNSINSIHKLMFIFIVTVNCVTLCCMEFGVIVLQMSAIIAIEYKDSHKNYSSNHACKILDRERL